MQAAQPDTEVNNMVHAEDTWLNQRAYDWQRYGKWDGSIDRLDSREAQLFWQCVSTHRMMGVASI